MKNKIVYCGCKLTLKGYISNDESAIIRTRNTEILKTAFTVKEIKDFPVRSAKFIRNLNRYSLMPNCKGDVKYHFWINFTTHFALLGSIYIRFLPKKDPSLLHGFI